MFLFLKSRTNNFVMCTYPEYVESGEVDDRHFWFHESESHGEGLLNKQFLLSRELLWELSFKLDDQISTCSWVAGQGHSLSCHQLAVLWTVWNRGYLFIFFKSVVLFLVHLSSHCRAADN